MLSGQNEPSGQHDQYELESSKDNFARKGSARPIAEPQAWKEQKPDHCPK